MEYVRRHLEGELREAFGWAKAILLVGARQAGKTTLLRHVFPELRMVTFDPVTDTMGARANPELFLETLKGPTLLDEAQYAPELFSALKRRMDEEGTAGQYVLSGSQNPLLLKQIAESLAGRMVVYEMEGYSVAERTGRGGGGMPWLARFLANGGRWEGAMPEPGGAKDGLMEVLWRGGLPEATRIPARFAKRYMSSYVRTYLERDARVAGNVSDLAAFGQFLGLCAALSGQEINRSQFGREAGVSPATAEKWLGVLRATFQWRESPPWKGDAIKRVTGKSKGYFADTGLMVHLLGVSSPAALLSSPQRGAVFETFAAAEIRKQLQGRGETAGMYHWRTNGGAEVDFVLERDGVLHPFEAKCTERLGPYDLRGIKAFRATYGDAAGEGGIIYAGRDVYRLDERTMAIPWDAV